MANDKYFLKTYSQYLDDANGHPGYEMIFTYTYSQDHLADKERKFVEQHLAKCDACSAKHQEILENEQAFSVMEKRQKATIAGFYLHPKILRYAAIAALLMLFGGYWFFYQNDAANRSGELFVASPVLESYVDLSNDKENNTRDIPTEFEMLSPENNVTLFSPIQFTWKASGDHPLFKLTILNNTGTIIWEASTQEQKLICPQIFPPGLYYWKIESGTDLLTYRKFYIDR